MTQRILILTAGFGEGHNAAARHLEIAFNHAAGGGTARTVDLFALTSPRLNAVLRRFYIKLINRAPKLWSWFYAWLDRSNMFPGGLWLFAKECRTLAHLISSQQPTAICSTYPVYAFMIERLTRDRRISAPPCYNIVTDSISINSLWWRAHCEGWFVPNEDSAEVLRGAGIDRTRLHSYGFPTPAYILEHPELIPPDLNPPVSADQPPAAPRVLYVINSGTRGAELTAHLLLAEQDWEITCTVGRDDELRARLQKLTVGRKRAAQILGWTDQIPHLLLTHHVVVSKAGGATTQEAIAACCPMIVNQIVPGQEEGNYELLRRHGIGMLAETPEAVLAACHRAFAAHGTLWHEWREAIGQIARPDAANVIVAHVLRELRANNAKQPTSAETAPGPALPAKSISNPLGSATALR